MKKTRKKPADRKKKINFTSSESEPEFQENLNSSDEDAPSTSAKKPSRARVNLLSKVKNINTYNLRKNHFQKKGKKTSPKPKKESSEESESDGSSSGFDF